MCDSNKKLLDVFYWRWNGWIFHKKNESKELCYQMNLRNRCVVDNDLNWILVFNADFCAIVVLCVSIGFDSIYVLYSVFADLDSYRGLTNTHYTLSIQNSTVPSSIGKLNNEPTLFWIWTRHQYTQPHTSMCRKWASEWVNICQLVYALIGSASARKNYQREKRERKSPEEIQ